MLLKKWGGGGWWICSRSGWLLELQTELIKLSMSGRYIRGRVGIEDIGGTNGYRTAR